jgi:serine/threonine protein kinase
MPNERLRLHLEGQRIGSYLLVQRISAGGMAEVYLATHVDDPQRREVAVKVVCPTDEVTQESGITNISERFISEGILLKTLDHPCILPVYESGADRDYLYHAMEYVPNGSLADAICGRAEHVLKLPMPLPLTMDIIRQVGSALEYIHSRGIVHRDVKPGNLLVRIDQQDGWHLLLADFGVACRRPNAIQQEDQVTGTVAYMAPEVFSGWFSPASDQYSLAVMAFQLLTGHLPFEGTIDEQIAGHLQVVAPSVRMYVENLPWEVEEVVARALEKREIDRYPSVAAFVQELEAAYQEAETGEASAAIPSISLATLAAASAAASQATIPAQAARKTGLSYRIRTLLTFATALMLLLATLIILTAVPGGAGFWSFGSAQPGQLSGATHLGKSGGGGGTVPTVVVTATPASSVPTATQPVVIAQTDGAHLVAISVPPSVPAGNIFSFRLTLANTGTSTWIGRKGYQLTCDLLRHPAQNCPQGFVATLGKYAVAPGSEVTFQVWLTALTTPGVYTAWINMAHSSAPFGTQDIFVSVQTLPAPTPSPTAPPQPQSTPPSQATPTAPPPTASPSPEEAPTVVPSPTPVSSPSAAPSPSASIGVVDDNAARLAQILSGKGFLSLYTRLV